MNISLTIFIFLYAAFNADQQEQNQNQTEDEAAPINAAGTPLLGGQSLGAKNAQVLSTAARKLTGGGGVLI